MISLPLFLFSDDCEMMTARQRRREVLAQGRLFQTHATATGKARSPMDQGSVQPVLMKNWNEDDVI